MLHSRDGHKVYVRVVDPCDPEPKPVETYKGDELIMMEHISHISHHLMQEATRGTCSRNGSAAITSLQKNASARYSQIPGKSGLTLEPTWQALGSW
jgi:hypothetical protein